MGRARQKKKSGKEQNVTPVKPLLTSRNLNAMLDHGYGTCVIPTVAIEDNIPGLLGICRI